MYDIQFNLNTNGHERYLRSIYLLSKTSIVSDLESLLNHLQSLEDSLFSTFLVLFDKNF